MIKQIAFVVVLVSFVILLTINNGNIWTDGTGRRR